LGAVIHTRGGRRRDHWSTYSADEAWEAAMKVEVDVEDAEVEVPEADVKDPRRRGKESGQREENDA
ncbi:MAG TPA: hypothetical protein VMM35_13015, partial [Longimicrobiales bacterium]|nr:hypothetical protein [Longimicrobiales bacterium]